MRCRWLAVSLRGQVDPTFARTERRRRVLAAVPLAAIAWLSGCAEQDPRSRFKGTDITGSSVGGDFGMPDSSGRQRSLSEFRGKVVVLFFGFLQCPDVCPTTLSEAAAAMKVLGAKADDVQVVFVTVDAERDTPELLGRYVTAFDSRFIGLRGSASELEFAARQFKVYYAKSETTNGYSMDHSAGQFVLDRQGRARLLIPHDAGAAVLAHDLGVLLR